MKVGPTEKNTTHSAGCFTTKPVFGFGNWEVDSFHPHNWFFLFPILTSDERACHFLVVVLSGFTN